MQKIYNDEPRITARNVDETPSLQHIPTCTLDIIFLYIVKHFPQNKHKSVDTGDAFKGQKTASDWNDKYLLYNCKYYGLTKFTCRLII